MVHETPTSTGARHRCNATNMVGGFEKARVISEKRRNEMNVNAVLLNESGLHGWDGESMVDLSDII